MQYVRVELEARRMPIKCWDPNCDAPIAEWVLNSVLDDEQHVVWMNRAKKPIGDPNFKACPTPDCEGFYLTDGPEDSTCECAICNHR